MSKTIRIGGASGYWGDSDMALPQFLKAGGLDYIVFDYLAEITMSIMARQRAKDPAQGYAADFVSLLKPHLNEIKRQGVKILSNAGGVNPRACGEAMRAAVKAAGVDLKVAVVEGDDLIGGAEELRATREMFSGEAFPAREKVASINAYLGGFPIAEALKRGADIVITGRNVDSAVTLGACIHEFGWLRDQADLLAAGSLCGHILECGAQATGGNYTDWESVADTLWDIGYPIAEVSPDGGFIVTKADGSGGAVTVGTVGEQMLYEIGDPQAYVLPDAVCDFSGVRIAQAGKDRVAVSGAKGLPAPDTYKVSATYEDGFRAGAVWFFYGEDAAAKARVFAESSLKRARNKLRAANAPDYDEVLVEVMGDESLYGAEGRNKDARDVALKVAVKHRDQRAAGLILKELTGHGLAGPPGLSGFAGGRPAPSPVVRLFSFLTPKAKVPIRLRVEDEEIDLGAESGKAFDAAAINRPAPPALPGDRDLVDVPLIRLAYARSGDKGDNANIGVLARDPRYAPWIWAKLTEAEVARRFAHFLKGPKGEGKVERFWMPGPGAMNFLLHNVLGGGGVASLRNDPQAKGYSQILLQTPIPIPRVMAENSLMPVFQSRVSPSSAAFQKNRADMLRLTTKLNELNARAPALSAKRKARFEERGQLLPRERLARLLDPGMPWLQISNIAGYLVDTPDEAKSIAGSTIFSGIGFIKGVRCVVVVDDSGIQAGAMTSGGGYRLRRAQEIALQQKMPFVHLVESAGGDLLNYKVEGFVSGGALFANLARLSARGMPVIALLHGSSTAGGAYMPGLSDYVVAVKGRGRAFLAGPPLLKAATGEIATEEELGGADMHATVSGLAEYLAENDADACVIGREIVGRLGWNRHCPPPPPRSYSEPTLDPDEIAGIVPIDYRTPYDAREVIARIVDGSDFSDFKPGYGVSTVCAQAEVMGHPIGIIANNGPIDPDGATKCAQFLQLMDQAGTPAVFLQNTTGYLVGKQYEQGGMIKHGSKMIQAVTNISVPRITFMIGASYGAGNYGMCGRGYDPDFVYTWPNASTGVMGGEQAAMVMSIVAEGQAKAAGVEPDRAALKKQEERLTQMFNSQANAFYCSGHMMDDGMIDPRETRKTLGFLLATVWEARAREVRPNSFGVGRM